MSKKTKQEKSLVIVEAKNLSKVFEKKTKIPGLKKFFKQVNRRECSSICTSRKKNG